jgi:hypothetical protein
MWRAGDRSGALSAWRELQVRRSDYYAASSSYLLDVVNGVGSAISTEAAARITKILDNEEARWLNFSTARLRRFGYTPDSF